MALTKISTGGVKDDAASQAKIADEAVDEARLQVSNAGTNGQFLSKQSGNTGGLTWATVTVPDADKIEEGNTSVETVDTGSDGHVKITTEGTERVRVLANGNVGIGTDAPSWPLEVKGIVKHQATNSTNGFVAYTHTDNTYRLNYNGAGNDELVIKDTGAVAFSSTNYGSSGQVLTSGGASAAPSWTTISAAPEVTATASGAIAANKPVIIQSDGKIAEITEISAATGSATQFDANEQQYPKLAYDTTNNKVLCVYERVNGGGNGNPYAVAGVVSSGSVSWGTPVQLSNNFNVGSGYAIGVEFDASVGQFIAYAFGGSVGNLYRISITSTDTVNSTAYAMSDASMRSNTYNSLCLEGNGNGTYFFIDEGDGQKIKAVHISYTSSSLSQGSKEELANENSAHRMVQGVFVYVSGQNKYICAGRKNGSNDQPYHLITRTNSTYAVGVTHMYDTTNNGSVGQATHQDIISVGDDFVFTYKSEAGHLIVDAAKVSGTSITGLLNQTVQLDTSISDDVAIEYYAKTEEYYINYNKSSTIYRIIVKVPNAGTAAPTIKHTSVSISANIGHGMGLTYDPDSEKMIHAYAHTSSGGTMKSVMRTEQSTNITANNFLGFATAAISDTASGTVAVTGNTTTQSGLTTGAKHYITNTGGLSTTAADPSVEAGIALSSTKLLIKG